MFFEKFVQSLMLTETSLRTRVGSNDEKTVVNETL